MSLEELLQPLGSVQVPRRVAGEVREIDVWFAPATSPPVTEVSKLGLLGRLATTPAIIEPLLSLPPEEFTPLLLQLSREELLARFSEQSSL